MNSFCRSSLAKRAALTVLVGALGAACAEPLASRDGAATTDASTDASTDTSDDAFQSAAHAPFPQVPNQGGALLRHPRVVTITYADDPHRVDIDSFARWVTTSQWLITVGAEYGIYQEYGTRFMPAHPYFTPAVEAVRPQFEAAVAAALRGLA